MRTYQFKHQIRNRGLYAKITYDVIVNSNMENRAIHYYADKRWENAVMAGIMLFENYYPGPTEGNLEFTIYEVNWMPVDSDELIVMFATMNALCEALNFKINLLKFDPVNEVFILPDRRALLNNT